MDPEVEPNLWQQCCGTTLNIFGHAILVSNMSAFFADATGHCAMSWWSSFYMSTIPQEKMGKKAEQLHKTEQETKKTVVLISMACGECRGIINMVCLYYRPSPMHVQPRLGFSKYYELQLTMIPNSSGDTYNIEAKMFCRWWWILLKSTCAFCFGCRIPDLMHLIATARINVSTITRGKEREMSSWSVMFTGCH